MFELTVSADFASAHQLHGYQGDCKDLHGHTWKVEVVVASDRLDSIGMVVDFKAIKKQLKDFLKQIDHVYLNDVPAFKNINPTTENLAKFICEGFSKVCQPLSLKRVRIWESETSSVTYYPSLAK
jgi:6-pyruvoyltetrahydropterin/6-carboxytetrahydropterin synthase